MKKLVLMLCMFHVMFKIIASAFRLVKTSAATTKWADGNRIYGDLICMPHKEELKTFLCAYEAEQLPVHDQKSSAHILREHTDFITCVADHLLLPAEVCGYALRCMQHDYLQHQDMNPWGDVGRRLQKEACAMGKLLVRDVARKNKQIVTWKHSSRASSVRLGQAH